MIWWFMLPVVGALLRNGPWFLVAMALQWGLRIGVGKWSPGIFIVELLILLMLEWTMDRLLPLPPVQQSPTGLVKESWILMTLSLLLNPLPGWIAWQGSVGFDGTDRIRTLNRYMAQILKIRAIKGLLIIALALLVQWSGPWT
ncbi:MAG: hypothetical protein M1596_05585 [Firmicutes bacterium]|nr:hypothetical protein [Bacillota bacterium]